jgi:hypothetical protein
MSLLLPISLLDCLLQVVRSLFSLVSRLLTVTKSSSSGLDELDIINQNIAKVINDGLANYDKYPLLTVLLTLLPLG